jgi:glycosyltransferase involved in cell wall biosynthesis
MKKILFIVTSLEVGGLETYLLRFLEFSNNKINAIVFCKSGKGGVLEKKYSRLGVTIVKYEFGYFPIFSSLKLYNFLKKEKFDTVCDFTGDFAGLTLLLARLANIENRLSNYRSSEHRFNQDIFRMFYNRIVNFLVYKNATKILSNSQAALDFFYPDWKKNKKKFQIIRNGVPIELFSAKFDKRKLRSELGIPDDAFLIGHVARFHSSKNHRTIIKVAEHLCYKYNKVYFLLCGLGVQEGMTNLIEIGKARNKIIMPGLRHDIPNVLRIMDAYYFPSLVEGQPNALLEAAMVGLPFVASNIKTIKETIPINFHDCLVPPEDSDSAIAILSTFIEGTSKKNFLDIKNFAQNEFNAEMKFNQFLKEL